MGMIGTAAKHALNFAGRNLLGVDFMREARERERQERLAQITQSLFAGQPASAGPVGPGEDGAPTGGTVARPAGMPGMDAALPKLAPLIMQGDKSAAKLMELIQGAQPKAEPFVEGPDGIYQRRGNDWVRAREYPEKAPTVSPGWTQKPDGSWAPVPGGPYDPAYIGQTSGIRRDAVVDRPMPRVGGGGKGGGKRTAADMSDAELLAIILGGK